MSSTDKPAEKVEKAPLDGDAMSAPDQLEMQQLVAQRADAASRGDKQAVKDLDAQLAKLTGNTK
jgi:hypothetical protein